MDTGLIKLCSGARQLLKSEEDLTLNEQLWSKEPDSESQQARELMVPVPGDQTIQENHSTECSRVATLTGIANSYDQDTS